MQIFNELNENKAQANKNLSLAFGFFDGVHIGHQAVIKSAVDHAKEMNTNLRLLHFKTIRAVIFTICSQNIFITKHDKVKMLKIWAWIIFIFSNSMSILPRWKRA